MFLKVFCPSYYDDQSGEVFKAGRLRAWDNTLERVKVREKITRSRLSQLKRKFI